MNNSNTEVTINQNKVHLTKFQKMLQSYIRHYDHKKYWKMRERVINYKNGVLNKLLCYWYLFRIFEVIRRNGRIFFLFRHLIFFGKKSI